MSSTAVSACPWSCAMKYLGLKVDSWLPVNVSDLVDAHVSANLMFVLARIAGVRPPFGQSLFEGVLCRTPGARRDGDAIAAYEQSQYDSDSRSLQEAEEVLAEALRGYGAAGPLIPTEPVDELVVHYLNDLTSEDETGASAHQLVVEVPMAIDMRGMRELLGAVEAEGWTRQKKHGFLDRLLGRGHEQSPTNQAPGAEPEDAAPTIEVAPQWLSVEALQMIDVARIVSLTSWQEALAGLPPRVCQLLWTAADDPAISPDAAYRPVHDPQVLGAFAAVPYEERSAQVRPGVHSDHAVICRRYGRDPVDDNVAARLQAVREAAGAWSSWREELADGALAARGLIDVDGLTRLGEDPFLRQQYALDVKNTVRTERWVSSWLDAGGLLKE